MSAQQTIGISYRRATAVSVALHLLAVVAFFWSWVAPMRDPGTRSPAPSEAVRVSQITVSVRAPRAAPAARALPAVRPLPAASAPVRKTILTPPMPLTIARTARATRPAARGARRAIVPPSTMQSAPAGLIVDAKVEPATPAPVAVPTAAAQTAATPAPVVLAATQQSSGELADVPSGGWGQSFSKPIVADDDALASLRATIHASDLSADVTVDDAGRATRVTLPSGLADDVRAEIEQRLLALRYVPAECNGLRCAATLRIAL